ncbi:MAG: hypothetical protein ACREDR_18290, partial [Blastocatellia bacterium]
PGEPFTIDESLPEQIKRVVISAKDHVYDGNSFSLAATHAVMAIQLPIGLFTETYMKHISSSAGVSNFKYTLGAEKSGRIPIRGSFVEEGQAKGFEGFGDLHGNNVWLLIAMYTQSNKSGGDDVRKALASAAFDGPECADQ